MGSKCQDGWNLPEELVPEEFEPGCQRTGWHDAARNAHTPSWCDQGIARLVVIAEEVAGRWSEEAASFLRHLVKARSRCKPAILQKRAERCWRLRSGSMLACAAARAFAQSLFLRRVPGGRDGPVVADFGQSNFGQSIFGQPIWPANFGQFIFGQY